MVDKVKMDLSFALSKYEKVIGMTVNNRSRKKEVTAPRHAFMAAARRFMKNTTTEIIGEVLSRDHSSVVHSTKVVDSCLEMKDPFSVKVTEYYKIAEMILRKFNKDLGEELRKEMNKADLMTKYQDAKSLSERLEVDTIRLKKVISRRDTEISNMRKELNETKEKLRVARLLKTDPELLRLEQLKEQYGL